MRCSINAREKPLANKKDTKDKVKIHFLPIGQKEKEQQQTKFKAKKGQKGNGYTAEEASATEPEANEGQWLEPVDISPFDTWQADSFSWD